MKAAVITSPGVVVVEDVPDPIPGPRDVVLEVAACGICGTDLHILQGEFAPSLPIVPGHEFSGTVVAVGREVTKVRVGDRVTADPNMYCGECFYCKRAHNNMCEDFAATGVTTSGAAADYVVTPEGNCWVVPESIEDLRNASLVEPLSCALHGFDVLDRRPGANYLIYGSGVMGLMMMQLARRMGASSVQVVDINADRLSAARHLGFDDVATSADEFDRGRGWQVVIDCTGAPAAIADGIGRVQPAGEFLMFGVAGMKDTVPIEPYRIFREEIAIKGSFAVLHSFDRAGELLASGLLDTDFMISHRLPLDEFPTGLEMVAAGVGRKVQVTPAVRA